MMWDTIAEENCDTVMDCLSFQSTTTMTTTATTSLSKPPPSATFKSARRLNMDDSFGQMVCDDDQLTFFDDASSLMQREKDDELELQSSFAALADEDDEADMLLPDEGSPLRFRITSNSSSSKQHPGKLHHSPAATTLLSGRSQLTQSNIFARQQPAISSSMTTTLHNNHHQKTTPKGFRVFHSLSSESMESSMDDEYMELFEMESLEPQSNEFKFPSNLNSLFCGKIQSSTISPQQHQQQYNALKTPEMRRPSVRRCLSMTENQQKTPEYLEKLTPSSQQCFKRPDPPSLTCSPIQTKRYRLQEKENLDSSSSAYVESMMTMSQEVQKTTTTTTCTTTKSTVPVLRKCMSMNDADIMTALTRSESKDEPDLIGDFSRPFALPLLEGRHRDLKSISSDTVARLIRGEFQEKVGSYKIIDCRYPYEFEGGHIRGAKNLYTQEQIIEEFLTHQKTDKENNIADTQGKRDIIIFHCEFSSERGPKLSRFLRNNDRARNTNAYPALDYPEIYLLHNGYKEFFETHSELCDPIAYRPMLEPSYNEAYRHFRAKSKSWNGDGLGGGTTRLKKSRSRLML